MHLYEFGLLYILKDMEVLKQTYEFTESLLSVLKKIALEEETSAGQLSGLATSPTSRARRLTQGRSQGPQNLSSPIQIIRGPRNQILATPRT